MPLTHAATYLVYVGTYRLDPIHTCTYTTGSIKGRKCQPENSSLVLLVFPLSQPERSPLQPTASAIGVSSLSLRFPRVPVDAETIWVVSLHFTSGHHPEGDSQTKWMNQTLKQYLQIYSTYQQDNWSKLLPLTEFWYNNALSATTRVSPFFANKGYHPNITVHLECDLSSVRA